MLRAHLQFFSNFFVDFEELEFYKTIFFYFDHLCQNFKTFSARKNFVFHFQNVKLKLFLNTFITVQCHF